MCRGKEVPAAVVMQTSEHTARACQGAIGGNFLSGIGSIHCSRSQIWGHQSIGRTPGSMEIASCQPWKVQTGYLGTYPGTYQLGTEGAYR